jgi:hypothetical protein
MAALLTGDTIRTGLGIPSPLVPYKRLVFLVGAETSRFPLLGSLRLERAWGSWLVGWHFNGAVATHCRQLLDSIQPNVTIVGTTRLGVAPAGLVWLRWVWPTWTLASSMVCPRKHHMASSIASTDDVYECRLPPWSHGHNTYP